MRTATSPRALGAAAAARRESEACRGLWQPLGLVSLFRATACPPDATPADTDALGVDNGCKWTMMRHGKKIHRLGRPADQRKALLRALTTQLLTHGAIKTTKQKARAVRPWVDKMIVLAKEGSDAKKKQVRNSARRPQRAEHLPTRRTPALCFHVRLTLPLCAPGERVVV